MSSFSGSRKTLLFAFTVQHPGPAFLNSLQSNTENASQKELPGCPEISISSQLQILLVNPKLSLWRIQTQFVTAIHPIRGASWEALVLKEGQDEVREWMPAAFQSVPTLPPSSHVPCAPQGILT